MMPFSTRRLGFVILSAVLLTSLLTWRLQASGLRIAMFDSSSSPISPIGTPTPTGTPASTSVPVPTRTPTPTVTPTPVPPPVVIRVAPAHGDNATASRVTIYGAHFQEPPVVTIGAIALAQVQRVNHTEIQGDVPAGLAPGAYAIHVCNPDAQCGQLEGAFTVTDAAPILVGIVPTQGQSAAPNDVTIFGHNLRPGISIAIGPVVLSDITWVSSDEVRSIVPAGLPAGVYDVTASNPGVPGVAMLAGGYTVLDATSDDFFVTEADIWTDPVTLRQGETLTVLLGANVHRQGGVVAKAVAVSFYLGDPAADGVLLGTATTALMPPVIGAVEPVFIAWNLGAHVGSVAIYVQVDPAGQVAETNEANNLARRDLLILPPAPDVTPPTITSLTVNDGNQSTTDPALQVAVKATDDRSGVYSIYLVERIFNATANMWLAVQHTGWIPFQGVHTFTLTDPGGARYIEAWVADGVGNVTPLSTRVCINYLPLNDTVLEGQVRVFRFTVASGERLAATLATLNVEGDADLYVWGPYHPEGRTLWRSDNAGMTLDEVDFVATEAGDYEVEVRGWNARSEYRLTVALSDLAAGASPATAPTNASSTAKPVPSRPANASAATPADRSGVPAAPIAPPSKVYLSLVMLNYQASPPQQTYELYLPIILRNYAAPQLPGYKIALPLVLR